jgi:hypothetical protein
MAGSLHYLSRLSDLLFILARTTTPGHTARQWQPASSAPHDPSAERAAFTPATDNQRAGPQRQITQHLPGE